MIRCHIYRERRITSGISNRGGASRGFKIEYPDLPDAWLGEDERASPFIGIVIIRHSYVPLHSTRGVDPHSERIVAYRHWRSPAVGHARISRKSQKPNTRSSSDNRVGRRNGDSKCQRCFGPRDKYRQQRNDKESDPAGSAGSAGSLRSERSKRKPTCAPTSSIHSQPPNGDYAPYASRIHL
jgi:hypothetical protein